MPGLFNKSIIIVISNGQGPISVFRKMTEVSCVSCEILRDEIPALFIQTSIKWRCEKIFDSLFDEESALQGH